MVSVYKITDCNGLNYIGTTVQKLSYRLNDHRSDKKARRNGMTSSKLDLDNCEITLLETCNHENRNEREQYYMDVTECVNTKNTVRKFCRKTYNKNARETKADYYINYRERNRKKAKSYMTSLYQYQLTWGGIKYKENNLLMIDDDLFL